MINQYDVNGNISTQMLQNTAGSAPVSDLRTTADVVAIDSVKTVTDVSALAKASSGNANLSQDQLNESVDAVVSNISDYVQSVRRELQFSVDKETGSTVIKVINQETSEVVRQIPSEEFLKLAKTIRDFQSVLLDEIV